MNKNDDDDEMIEEEHKKNVIDDNISLVGYGTPRYFKLDSIKHENIVKCASFYNHSLFVDVKGNVYGIGRNDDYQLGLNHNDKVNIPQSIPINANIVDVAVDYRHSILLCDKGCIYTMGWNEYGQCGQGNEKYIKSPLKCSYFDKKTVMKISAGNHHSGVITSDNCAYLFGRNVDGQCAVPFRTNTKIPQKVSKNAKDISCGDHHTLITTVDHALYGCGWNKFGQVGNGTNKNQFGLVHIQLPHCVVDADCGGYHSLCVLSNGTAHAWGSGEYGHLGLGNDTSNKYVPTKIHFGNIKFKKCVAGYYNSCLFDEDNNLYVFGDNDKGQLCVVDKEDKYVPTKIQQKNVMDISMGHQYTFLMFGKKLKNKKEEKKESEFEKAILMNEIPNDEIAVDEAKESEIGREVELWLCKELRLPKAYFQMFIDDGFDDMRVIVQTLNENDLKEMEYENVKIKKGHRRKIMLSIAEKKKKQNKNDEIDQQIEGSQIDLNVHQANILDTVQ